MKKKIMMIAAALIGVLGITANAQTPQCPRGKVCQDSVNCQAGDMNKMRQPREFTEFAFEGILLEPAQQMRMDSLNAAVKAQQPANPQKGKCCNQENCANCPNCQEGQTCQKCDTTACAKQAPGNCKKGFGQGQRNGKGMRGAAPCPYGPEYIAKVKEILTPDQYTMFLENIINMAPCPNGGKAPGQCDRVPKCDKAPRCEKATKCAKAAKGDKSAK